MVHFSQPIMIDYYRILVKRGRPKANPWGFLFPLAPGVWLGLCFSFGLVIAALAVTYLASYDPRTTIGRFMVVLVSCWDQYSVLMNQSTSIRHQFHSIQFVHVSYPLKAFTDVLPLVCVVNTCYQFTHPPTTFIDVSPFILYASFTQH